MTIIEQHPQPARKGEELLEKWTKKFRSVHGDLLGEVMAEGGAQKVCGVNREDYIKRLDATGRNEIDKESF